MSARPSLSVILPLYNEIEILEANLLRIDGFLSRHFNDYEIVIVESGSTDASAAACDRLAARLERVRVIHEGARNGIGSATRIGFQYASKDLVWRYAIDLPCPLEAILEALPLLATNDCVLSYRASDERGRFRKVQSFVYNEIAKVLLGVKVRHVNSSFKAFRTEVIKSMPLRSNSSAIDGEMVFWVGRQRRSWAEIPVLFTDRTGGRSTVPLTEPFAVLAELLRLRRAAARLSAEARPPMEPARRD